MTRLLLPSQRSQPSRSSATTALGHASIHALWINTPWPSAPQDSSGPDAASCKPASGSGPSVLFPFFLKENRENGAILVPLTRKRSYGSGRETGPRKALRIGAVAGYGALDNVSSLAGGAGPFALRVPRVQEALLETPGTEGLLGLSVPGAQESHPTVTPRR